MHSIYLEKTMPIKMGQQWEVGVIAHVTHNGRHGRSAPRVPITFYLEFTPAGSVVKTDEKGIARKRFSLPVGTYTIFAQARDERPGKIVIAIEEKKLKPSIFSVREERRTRGEHWLYFQVLTEDKIPVKDAVIFVTNASPHDCRILTDELGSAKYPVLIFHHERRKMISVAVLGTTLQKTLNIIG